MNRTNDSVSLLMSATISLAAVLSTRVVLNSDAWGNCAENYISGFGWKAVLLFLVLFPVLYAVLKKSSPVICAGIEILSVSKFSSFSQDGIEKSEKSEKSEGGLLWTLTNVITWIPYYLSYYPGGLYSDTIVSINCHYQEIVNNHHPILYNAAIGAAFDLADRTGNDANWAMALFMTMQMLLGILAVNRFYRWMTKYRIRALVKNVCMAFMIFFPLIPLNMISVWKDTPFALAFLCYMMSYVDMIEGMKNGIPKKKTTCSYVIFAFLTAFTRNNGKYVIAVSALALCFACLKCVKKRKKFFFPILSVIVSTIIIFVIQGPVYDLAEVQQTEPVENYSIPLQQVGYVVANGGNITDEQLGELSKFVSIQHIKDDFCPCLVDSLKWSYDFNHEYFNAHQIEFLKLWFELFLQNPTAYFREFLLETVGFWNLDSSDGNAYVQNYVVDNNYGIEQTDLFERIFGFSFQHFSNPRHYLSCALALWVFLAGLYCAVLIGGWKQSVYFVPPMSIWLTVMIATPVAWSLRYVESMLFTLPFTVLIPILLQKRKSGLNRKRNLLSEISK